MSAALLIGIPSKGRLQENAASYFARAGLTIQRARGERDYRGHFAGLDDVEIQFLSASEIAAELARGGLHFGVTGEDLIRENIPDADRLIELVAPLGFGQADVVVAVPQAWIDVTRMEDVEDVAAEMHARTGQRLRVATKYVRLTRQFFARHGVSDYRIVESLGATEGAPLSGAAEAIVDITTTGATLAANALKILDDGVILRSQANLAASLRADWTKDARSAASRILDRIVAEERARKLRDVRAAGLADPAMTGADAGAAFGASLLGLGDGTLSMLVEASKAQALAEWLVAAGAKTAAITTTDYVFSGGNPLIDRLNARLPAL
jgi:ATP phosphoribosyltransferase